MNPRPPRRSGGRRAFMGRLTGGSRRGLVATAAGVVLAVLGAAAIVVAVASQRHAPQPPPSAAGSTGRGAGSARTLAKGPSRQLAAKVVGRVLPASKPVALDILAIGVHTPLLYLGLTSQGTLEVPPPGPHYNEAAWYKYSPTPGALGPAIIMGHVDSAADGPSVFYKLGDLRPGDQVLVHRADGLAAVFTVDGVRRYPKNQFPTHLVYGNTNHAALRLVTCGGSFDSATGHYLDNIVVFASLATSNKAS